MIKFRTNSVARICPRCRRVFYVAPTAKGYSQKCLFCDKPLEVPTRVNGQQV
jgi:hypothetical protein